MPIARSQACWDQAAVPARTIRFDAPVDGGAAGRLGVEVTIGDDVVAARVAVVAAAGWSGGLLEPDVARAAGACRSP